MDHFGSNDVIICDILCDGNVRFEGDLRDVFTLFSFQEKYNILLSFKFITESNHPFEIITFKNCKF